ncbi:MAG: peptidylprolyl isomerase [Rickettsiales bacterium]|nr:peptidylprolyl isomerase [Rickettsiales bacterium]|tara:strand:+ start:3844 stop:4458 length:615 start_codon:yes stop_codon:yes gene_type:complete
MKIQNILKILSISCLIIVSFTGCKDTVKYGSLLENPDNPVVRMKTTQGDIFIELFEDRSPITVDNFLKYVDSDFYDGTLFHRVIDGFMIQGGGLTEGLTPKQTLSPIKNEADNGLNNKRGTISMARSKLIDSATSQFFINVNDNFALDYKTPTPREFGYAVFGKVIEGMSVVDTIKQKPTTTVQPYKNVPINDIKILKVILIKN